MATLWAFFCDDRTVPQVIGHSVLRDALDQHLGQLHEQTIFANRVFGFRLIGKQAVRQLEQFNIGIGPLGAFYGSHFSSISAVSCQMTVYTKFFAPSAIGVFALPS